MSRKLQFGAGLLRASILLAGGSVLAWHFLQAQARSEHEANHGVKTATDFPGGERKIRGMQQGLGFVWLLLVVAAGLGDAAGPWAKSSAAFCSTVALGPCRPGIGVNRPGLREGVAAAAPGSMHAHRTSLTTRFAATQRGSAVKMSSEVDVRAAPLYYGGLGRFLRAPDILRDSISAVQAEIEGELRPELEMIEGKLKPLQEELETLQKKYEETENSVFGSQILPVEIKTRPYKAEIKIREKELGEAEQELNALQELLKESEARYQSDGVVDVGYSGWDSSTVFPCKMKRSFGLGVRGDQEEVKVTVSSGKEGAYEVAATWKTDMVGQPLSISSDVDAEGDTRGLTLSFATPDEGPPRLCGVAEWYGETKGDDVEKRKEQLVRHLKMDGLQVVDADVVQAAVFSDPVPLKRRNELWIEVVPPSGAAWYDHASKIATDRAAKNTTFYQLKDCPWARVQPWIESTGFARSQDAPKKVAPSWSAGTFLKENTLKASFPAVGGALAIDKSSMGELALSFVKGIDSSAQPGQDEMVPYAVASVDAWPLTGAAVEKARSCLVESMKSSDVQVVDEGSFRVLVVAPGKAELWMRIAGDFEVDEEEE